MSNENRNHRFDYVELPAGSKDWGPDYSDTAESGVASGVNADPSHRASHFKDPAGNELAVWSEG